MRQRAGVAEVRLHRQAFGCEPGRGLHVAGHGVDELHDVARSREPTRVHARSAADVEDRERARRQMTLDDLARAHQLELTEPFADPARLVDVVLVVIGDLGGHHRARP